MAPRRALSLFVIAASLAGCGKLRNECRAVVSTANAFIADSEKGKTKGPAQGAEATAREARALAERYDKLATDLGALPVESEELAGEVAAYRKLALSAATSLRAAATALENKDWETARKKRVEFDEASRGEAPLVARINAVCKG
jgi:hypothetical protein